jgi:hypothetical protein
MFKILKIENFDLFSGLRHLLQKPLLSLLGAHADILFKESIPKKCRNICVLTMVWGHPMGR